jgi:hypothetical protein
MTGIAGDGEGVAPPTVVVGHRVLCCRRSTIQARGSHSCHTLNVEVTGYMIDVQCDERTLRIYPKSKAARFALTGAETRAVTNDGGHVRLKTRLSDGDVTIPRASLTGVAFKGASMLTNGRVTVATDDVTYQLHFRKRQQSAFETLALELGATV